MSAEQCEDFVRHAVGHALARDGSSGGCIRTVTITKAGIKRTFTPNDKVHFNHFPNSHRPSAASSETMHLSHAVARGRTRWFLRRVHPLCHHY